MPSNTKLAKPQKQWLKEARVTQPANFKVFHYPENRVTIGVKYTPGHNAAWVFVSLASPDEKKFRAKVGEYFVREAFDISLDTNLVMGIPVYVEKQNRHLYFAHESIADNLHGSVGVPYWEA